MASPKRARTILALASPVAVSRLSTTVMGLVDTLLVGRGLGTDALAAVGLGTFLWWTALCWFEGTLTGVNTWVAQLRGAGDERRGRVFGWQGIYIAVAGGVVLAVLASLVEPALGLARLPPESHGLTVLYTERVLLGSGFVMLMSAVAGYLQGLGNTRTPMWITLLTNAVNAVLDYAFIYGALGFAPRGVLGAADATVVASAVGAALSVAVFLWYPQAPRLVRPELRALGDLVRVGSNTGLQWLSEMVAFSVFSVIVNQISAVAGAANNVLYRLTHFAFMPATGVGVALTTLVGERCGAGDHDEADRLHRAGRRLCLLYMGSVGVLFLLARHRLLAVFSDEPEVVAAGARVMVLVGMVLLFDALAAAAAGALRGAGDVGFLKLWMLVTSYAVFLPLTVVLVHGLGLGLTSAWVASAVQISLFGIGVELRWRSGRWRAHSLVAAARG